MFLQYIGLFSAKPQSTSFGKIVHKGILAKLTLKLMPRRKTNRKSSFPDILKLFFRRQATINIPSQNQPLQHSSLSICSKKFDSPYYRPLQTLIPSYEGEEQLRIIAWP